MPGYLPFPAALFALYIFYAVNKSRRLRREERRKRMLNNQLTIVQILKRRTL